MWCNDQFLHQTPPITEWNNYTQLLQEQNWCLNKSVAELAPLENEGLENKIPIFVTNTACDYKPLKIIYHNYMLEENEIKDVPKVQLLAPTDRRAVQQIPNKTTPNISS